MIELLIGRSTIERLDTAERDREQEIRDAVAAGRTAARRLRGATADLRAVRHVEIIARR